MYIPNLEVLGAAEERRLARHYRRTRDPKAADRLVRAQLRLVVRIANRYRFTGHDPRDLFQAGVIGLLHALDRFEPARGLRLATYASSWIRAKIHQYLWANRRLVRASWRQRPSALLTREPLSDRDRERAAALTRHLSTPERDLELPLPAPAELMPDALVEAAELRAKVGAVVAAFTRDLGPRERAIFEARFQADEPRTLAALGHRFGITRERTRQIEHALLGRLRERVAQELGA